jgi:proteasome lid subunit RPN8/RPN11
MRSGASPRAASGSWRSTPPALQRSVSWTRSRLPRRVRTMIDFVFSSQDGSFRMVLPERCLREARRYSASSGSAETGGILVGRYSEDLRTAHVIRALGPPSDSRRGPAWFVRGVRGLQRALVRLWRNHEYYLGEWHYHPGAPNPSSTDVTQISTIAASEDYRCPEPILCIIGTGERIRCFVAAGAKGCVELEPQRLDGADTAPGP